MIFFKKTNDSSRRLILAPSGGAWRPLVGRRRAGHHGALQTGGGRVGEEVGIGKAVVAADWLILQAPPTHLPL